MNDVLYFGYFGVAGHYLYCSVDGKPRRNLDQRLEWMTMCDGTLLPQDPPQVEGEATLSFHHGYSVVSFWDRSGDSRGNSNSSFLAKGTHSFEEVLEMAREAFPALFDRFDFEIKRINPGEFLPLSSPTGTTSYPSIT